MIFEPTVRNVYRLHGERCAFIVNYDAQSPVMYRGLTYYINTMNNQKKSNKKAIKPKVARRAGKAPRRQQKGSVPAAFGTGIRSVFNKRLSSMPLRHLEPLRTINGSVASSLTAIQLNPGLASAGPWCARLARNFESYEVNGLRIHFFTRSGSTKTGRVVLAIDYDALDSSPTSFLQVANFEDAAIDSAWKDITLTAKVSNLKKLKERFVRDEYSVTDQDLRLSDIGRLYVWVEGMDNTDAIGDVFIEYDYVLKTPQVDESSFGVMGGTITGASSMTAANPLGVAPSEDLQNRGLDVNTASRITFTTPGTYQFNAYCGGTGLSGLALSAGSGVSATGNTATANAAATAVTRNWSVVVTVPNGYVDLTAAGTTVTSCIVFVGSVPEGAAPIFEESDVPCAKHKLIFERLFKMGRENEFNRVTRDCDECFHFVPEYCGSVRTPKSCTSK